MTGAPGCCWGRSTQQGKVSRIGACLPRGAHQRHFHWGSSSPHALRNILHQHDGKIVDISVEIGTENRRRTLEIEHMEGFFFLFFSTPVLRGVSWRLLVEETLQMGVNTAEVIETVANLRASPPYPVTHCAHGSYHPPYS